MPRPLTYIYISQGDAGCFRSHDIFILVKPQVYICFWREGNTIFKRSNLRVPLLGGVQSKF